MENQLNTIRIYAVGGCGIKIAKDMMAAGMGHTSDGAKLEFCFIDTSPANLSGIPESNYMIVGTGEGSGGVRAKNYEAAQDACPEIVKRFKPGHISVVPCSISGSSGAILAATLAYHLLEQGHMVIAIPVGDTTTRNETVLSIKGIQTMDGVADTISIPFIASYFENTPELSQSQVNAAIRARIALYAAAFSGRNESVDLEDLRNFLNYTKTTTYPPRASSLDVHMGEILTDHPVISLITMTTPDISGSPGVPVEYRKCGVINPDLYEKLSAAKGFKVPLHFTITAGFFNTVLEHLQQRLDWFDEQRAARDKPPIKAANANKSGFAL